MRLVVVSNRVAVPDCQAAQPGGMTVGIEAALKAHGGLWLGWSGRCSPDDVLPRHRLVRDGVEYVTLDLPEHAFQGYYSGFSNQVLWPLFHGRQDLVEFNASDYLDYLAINERFADALACLLKPDDLVWVHDYHLIPLASALRRRGIRNRIGFFLHTPFAEIEALDALPVAGAIATALCAYDLLGFQTTADRRNWRAFQGSQTSSARIGIAPLTVPPRSATLPIGIDYEAFAQLAAQGQMTDPQLALLFEQLAPSADPIIAVDRLDYSKGIAERFQAFDTFLTMYPAYGEKVALIQVAPPCRGRIAAYCAEMARVNRAYAQLKANHPSNRSVHLLTESVNRASLAVAYRRSRIGLVTPLRDGMNLVAKEYVAAQDPDDPGVLVLSRFAGAAEQIGTGALLVDPRDIRQLADALQQAVAMSRDERILRWQSMIGDIRDNDAAHWASCFIRMLVRSEYPSTAVANELTTGRVLVSHASAKHEATTRFPALRPSARSLL